MTKDEMDAAIGKALENVPWDSWAEKQQAFIAGMREAAKIANRCMSGIGAAAGITREADELSK